MKRVFLILMMVGAMFANDIGIAGINKIKPSPLHSFPEDKVIYSIDGVLYKATPAIKESVRINETRHFKRMEVRILVPFDMMARLAILKDINSNKFPLFKGIGLEVGTEILTVANVRELDKVVCNNKTFTKNNFMIYENSLHSPPVLISNDLKHIENLSQCDIYKQSEQQINALYK